MDLISSLPNDLLLNILLHLPHTADAARTSVLSRRWRHIWTHLPKLVLCYGEDVSAQAQQERVDAALSLCAAPAIDRIRIFLDAPVFRVPARRISSWLRCASQRSSGSVEIKLPSSGHVSEDEEESVVLPVCERAQAIALVNLGNHKLRIVSAGSAGTFTSLAYLVITKAHIDSSDLGAVVSSRCCSNARRAPLVLQ